MFRVRVQGLCVLGFRVWGLYIRGEGLGFSSVFSRSSEDTIRRRGVDVHCFRAPVGDSLTPRSSLFVVASSRGAFSG